MPTAVALVLVVGVIGPLLGMGLYALLMNGLRDVDEVTKVIVTVSVMLGMLQLATWVWPADEPRSLELLFGATNGFDVLGKTIRYGEIFVVLVAMFLAALDQTVVSTAIRTIADDLQGYDLQAWATTAFLITSTIVTPLYG